MPATAMNRGFPNVTDGPSSAGRVGRTQGRDRAASHRAKWGRAWSFGVLKVLKAACRAPQPARSALRRAVPGQLHASHADARTERDAIGFRRTAGAVATAATAAAHGGGGQGPVPRAWLGRIRLRTHPGRDPGRRAGQRRRGRPESQRRACACHHKIGFRGWTLQCHAVLQGRGAAPGPTARDAHPDSRVLV